MGLQADAPAVPANFFINLLLRASLAQFSHLYLFWALLASILAMLAYFIPWVFSAHLFILYLFYSHGLLLNHLGFLSPIPHPYLLFTFRSYWPLSQPNEFTNLFPGLPRPIYFLCTSYYSY